MKKTYLFLFALYFPELLLALFAGPHSCDWGNTVYFYAGIAVLSLSVIRPFFEKRWLIGRRVAFSFLFLLSSLLVWIIGFFAGDFKILCRLF